MASFPSRPPGASVQARRVASQRPFPQGGFTLLESLIVVTLVALVVAIALPSWLGFLDQRRVNMTQSMLYQALRRTQWDASQLRQPQRFSLRERNGRLEWASHPDSIAAVRVTQWIPLIEGVGLAGEDNTLLQSGGIYYVRFDHKGNVRSQLGRITVVGAGGRRSHRCVVVSTLLGAMRQGQGQARPNSDGRHCY
ncbi:Tfp pilus assembly protein FimT/FimU [Leptolyngbya sp. BL0902]|uniref:pilus assembly FimT family protein n=1 Tax=Leptolyngbya sp. BL0902 TaxID=1115757 RepID=UPI0018E73F5B|nr:prepilin-type N-terminal cleavage/methylation domain-containing protein [Leptolyngbya sp. BL0902]